MDAAIPVAQFGRGDSQRGRKSITTALASLHTRLISEGSEMCGVRGMQAASWQACLERRQQPPPGTGRYLLLHSQSEQRSSSYEDLREVLPPFLSLAPSLRGPVLSQPSEWIERLPTYKPRYVDMSPLTSYHAITRGLQSQCCDATARHMNWSKRSARCAPHIHRGRAKHI